jgi:hypothetical protein
MLEELERWEEAEMLEESLEKSSRKVIFKVECEKPDPKILKDYHIEGRIWILMWLEEMLECGFKISKEGIKEDIEDLKSDLSDIKRFEIIRDEWTRARDEIEENQKYV